MSVAVYEVQVLTRLRFINIYVARHRVESTDRASHKMFKVGENMSYFSHRCLSTNPNIDEEIPDFYKGVRFIKKV